MDALIVNNIEIHLTEDKGSVFANSLEVAKVFKKEHSKLVLKIEGFSERAKANFSVSDYKDSTGRVQKMYSMNRDGFSILVMGFTGKKAEDWKLDFIDGFNKMEAIMRETKQRVVHLPDFNNPAIAARAWADEVEAKQALEHKIIEKDKVILAVANLNIQAGEVSVGDFSKNLAIEGLGQNNLFAWLKARNFIMMNTAPYQNYVTRGYFVRKPSKKKINGEVRYTTMLTPKGTVWLTKMLKAEYDLD